MKGKLCFIVLSIILAVTIGHTSDISAYTYQGKISEGTKDHSELVVSADQNDLVLMGQVEPESLQEALTQVEQKIQEMDAEEALLEEPLSTVAPEIEETANITSSVSFPCTEEERVVLEKIVMAEAGGEDIIGQIMVANVILNRVMAGNGSIIEVVFAPGQFSPVEIGTYWTAYPTESVVEAVERALAGEDYSNGALFFVSTQVDSSFFWANATFVAEHGGHYFFR